jgi:hypothetical protein
MFTSAAFLVWTTLPQLAVLTQAPPLPYAAIVIASTLFSVAWHLAGGPPTTWLGMLDHEVAFLWFLADCYYLSDRREHFVQMLILNGAIGVADVGVTWLDQSGLIPYNTGHSVWHLASAAKSVCIARLIAARP